MLKYDWERSKKEIRGDYMQCISIFMYIIAGIIYEYLILMENPGLNIKTVIIGTLCCYAIILFWECLFRMCIDGYIKLKYDKKNMIYLRTRCYSLG